MYWQISSALILMSLFGVMAWLIVHARQETIYRPLAIVAFFCGLPAVAFSFWLTLGTALPLGTFLYSMPDGKHHLLGRKSVPKVGIFLMLDMGDHEAPAYVMLPWDTDLSKDVEDKWDLTGGNVEFSWNKNKPEVTDGRVPEHAFPPKFIDPNGNPIVTLPPDYSTHPQQGG